MRYLQAKHDFTMGFTRGVKVEHPNRPISGRYAQMGDGVLHAKVAMEIAGPPGNVTFLRSEAAVKAGLPVLKWGRIWHGHLSMETWLHI